MSAGFKADIRWAAETANRLHVSLPVMAIGIDMSWHVADTDVADLPVVVGGAELVVHARVSTYALSSSRRIGCKWWVRLY